MEPSAWPNSRICYLGLRLQVLSLSSSLGSSCELTQLLVLPTADTNLLFAGDTNLREREVQALQPAVRGKPKTHRSGSAASASRAPMAEAGRWPPHVKDAWVIPARPKRRPTLMRV
jgi:hypothetical protein